MPKKQSPKQRTAAPIGRSIWIPVLCLLTLAVLAVCLRAISDPFPRLEAAGYRITREEYLRAMFQARSDVLSDHAAAGISLTDWDAGTALGDPCQLTMERALEILTEYYAVSLLAVERGYLSDAGYDAMLRDMESINRRRQEALDTGAVVTGIPHFSADDYLSYRAASIRLQFCSDPDNPENQVTQSELLRRYEADRDNLYQQPDSMELAFLLVPAADDPMPVLDALRQKALQKGELAAALEEFPELKAYYREISVDPGSYSTYARSHGDILAHSQNLKAGDISRILDLDGWLCLIQCCQRVDHSYVPLEDVQSVVAQSIRESRYDALIAERMKKTEIRGDLQSLYRFTAEQLH